MTDSTVDKITADVLKHIEDEIRANHPGMSDDAIAALHQRAPCETCRTSPGRITGIDVPSPGYIYAPYIPRYVIGCRPWWQGVFHWSWWRTKVRELRIVRWWKHRRLMKRYAVKAIRHDIYRSIDVGSDP